MVMFSKLVFPNVETRNIFGRLRSCREFPVSVERPEDWKLFQAWPIDTYLVDQKDCIWYKCGEVGAKFFGILDGGVIRRYWTGVYDFDMENIEGEQPTADALELCVLPEEIRQFVVSNMLTKTPIGRNYQFEHTAKGCRPVRQEDVDAIFGSGALLDRWVGIDFPDSETVSQVSLTTGDLEWIHEPYRAPILATTGYLADTTEEIRTYVYLYCLGFDLLKPG